MNSMMDRSAQLELLLDLETRQDDLMSRLEELDRKVEKTLADCLTLRASETAMKSLPDAA